MMDSGTVVDITSDYKKRRKRRKEGREEGRERRVKEGLSFIQQMIYNALDFQITSIVHNVCNQS